MLLTSSVTNRSFKRRILLLALTAIGLFLSLSGQPIILDEPVRAGNLTLFPEMGKPNIFYYLPDKPRIARDKDEQPQISFIQYANGTGNSNSPISKVGGGGILHALVELEVSESQKEEALKELRKQYSGAEIKGPVIYSEGTIALVSSIAGADKSLSIKVLGLGNAPVLEGNKAAISVQLTKDGASLLWASLQSSTPDLSISFEMNFKGFRAPKSAIIEVDFDQLYKHQSFQAAAATPVLAGELNMALDEMAQNGAIRLEQIGDDKEMNNLIEEAYNKILHLMFDRVIGAAELNGASGDLAQASREPSLLDKTSEMLSNERSSSNSNVINAHSGSEDTSSIGLAIAVAYKLKNKKYKGKFRIDLNKYRSDQMSVRFDENFGNTECKNCFRRINPDEFFFNQRRINVFVDGLNSEDFKSYVNFVDVSLQKVHESGEASLDEIRVNQDFLNGSGNKFQLSYGWNGDKDQLKWMDYKYKAVWNFYGGSVVDVGWTKMNTGSIPLVAPFVKRSVIVEADPDTISKHGIRAIEVKFFFFYPWEYHIENYQIGTKKRFDFQRSGDHTR